MKSSVEKINSIRQKITIEVRAASVDKAFKAALEKVRKEAKVPGFRKGKVPDDVILQRFGNDVNVEATKEVISASYPEAIKQAETKPISDPHVDIEKPIEKGKPFTYSATIEIYPEVVATGYEDLSLTRQKVTLTDEEVETELKRLQQQMTQLEPAEGAKISHGIVATIDFKGTAGGKTFPGSEAENYVVDFGTGALLSEFEEQIKGMRAGEEKDISFHYPTDFFRREIAGKKGEFNVKVKELRTKVVPGLDDEFAKSLGDFKDLNAVRADLKKRILEYKERMETAGLREQAIRELIAKHQNLEVPTVLVDSELGNMLEQLKRQYEMQGQKFDTSKIDAKQFVTQNVKEATDRARGYMLARAVSAQEKLEVTDEEMDARISQMAAQSRSTSEQVRDYLNKNNMIDNLRAQVLFEKTLDLMVSKAKIKTEKPKKGKK
ncbi:trigger factor [Patescibacteria group bacterium]|nr:trigger factor [Patescibacteria group bacterium]